MRLKIKDQNVVVLEVLLSVESDGLCFHFILFLFLERHMVSIVMPILIILYKGEVALALLAFIYLRI